MIRNKISISLFFVLLLLFKLTHGFFYEQKQKNDNGSKHVSIPRNIQDTTFNRLQIFHYPDTIHYQFLQAERDSNFSYKKYMDFLEKVSDTSKFIVVPINQFRQTFDRKKNNYWFTARC